MRKILGGRAGGKTRRLIKHAARNNAVIVCLTKRQAKYIHMTASHMSAMIPKPVSLHELMSGSFSCYRGEIMLDEADLILEKLIGFKVSAATFSDNDVEKTWRRANPAIEGRDNLIMRCAFHKEQRG